MTLPRRKSAADLPLRWVTAAIQVDGVAVLPVPRWPFDPALPKFIRPLKPNRPKLARIEYQPPRPRNQQCTIHIAAAHCSYSHRITMNPGVHRVRKWRKSHPQIAIGIGNCRHWEHLSWANAFVPNALNFEKWWWKEQPTQGATQQILPNGSQSEPHLRSKKQNLRDKDMGCYRA